MLAERTGKQCSGRLHGTHATDSTQHGCLPEQRTIEGRRVGRQRFVAEVQKETAEVEVLVGRRDPLQVEQKVVDNVLVRVLHWHRRRRACTGSVQKRELTLGASASLQDCCGAKLRSNCLQHRVQGTPVQGLLSEQGSGAWHDCAGERG